MASKKTTPGSTNKRLDEALVSIFPPDFLYLPSLEIVILMSCYYTIQNMPIQNTNQVKFISIQAKQRFATMHRAQIYDIRNNLESLNIGDKLKLKRELQEDNRNKIFQETCFYS